MAITFEKIETEDSLSQLADMAAEIWNEYWPAIIGQDQTDYMVENFQSLQAIKRDVAEHDYEYWFIVDDVAAEPRIVSDAATEPRIVGYTATEPRIVGYTGGRMEPETNRFFISKIYLLANERGKGFAGATIRFYEKLCRDRGLHAMYLTVNKYNELGIRAYKGKGFETIDSVETDIGHGFIMDDYVMEKTVS